MLEEGVKILKMDRVTSSSIGPRCEKILKYLVENHQKIEIRKSGSITFHFSDRTLKVEEKNYKEL